MTPEQLRDVVRTAVGGGRRPRRARRRGARRGRRRAAEEPRARRLRHQRRAAAGQAGRPAAARGRRAARRRAARSRRHRARRRRRPGLPQHHRSTQRRAGRARRADRRRGRGLRPHRHAGRAADQPGVRLGQPDRARCTSGGTRWAAVGDALGRLLSAAGAEVDPGVLLQRRRRRRSTGSPQSCWPRRTGQPVPEDGYARRLHRRHRRAGRRAPSPGCSSWPTTSSWRCSASAGVELMFAEIKAVAGRLRRRLRRLLLRADAARHRRAGAGDRPAARAGPRLRGRRRGLAADHRLRRRQGPRAGQERRRADLLRRRLRLLPRQARARLRPGRHHARRRPPRLRRPATRRCRRVAATTRTQPRDPHRPAGQPGARRRAGADEQAGRHRRHARRPGRGDRRRRRPLRAGPLLDRPADRPRPRRCWTRQTNDNPVFYVQYAHARIASLLRNAADLGHRRGEPTTSTRAARARARGRPAAARSASSRGWSPPPPSCASRTGSPATWRSSPAPTTGSTTPAGCCRGRRGRRPTLTTRPALAVRGDRASCCANGLAVLGVSAPERM